MGVPATAASKPNYFVTLLQTGIYLFCLSFSNITIANIAILNPVMQIIVPLSDIFEFINPVNPFTKASIMKQKHITNAILENTV